MDSLLKVTGIAKTSVKPDKIVSFITMEEVLPTYEEALKSFEQKLIDLREQLLQSGFDRKKLKTSDFNINTHYENYKDENNNWQQKLVGYKYVHNMTMEIDSDGELLGKLIGALSGALVRPRFSFNYIYKEPEKLKSKLVAQAIEDAKSKAELIARSASLTLGNIVEINYFVEPKVISPSRRMPMMLATERSNDIVLDLEPDKITFSVSINIIWQIK